MHNQEKSFGHFRAVWESTGRTHLVGLQAMAVTALRQGACATLVPAESCMQTRAPPVPTASSEPSWLQARQAMLSGT